MATTTNYGWTTPNDTDLVKDGASAIRTLGSSIDTTTKALNPSTTLGDVEYRSATANTNTRLPIGTSGQVLAVNGSGVPAWATFASGSVTLVSTTAFSASSAVNLNNVFTSTYDNYLMEMSITGSALTDINMRMRVSGADNSTSNYHQQRLEVGGTSVGGSRLTGTDKLQIGTVTSGVITYANITWFNPNLSSPTGYLTFSGTQLGSNISLNNYAGGFSSSTVFDGITIYPGSGNITGTVRIYGLAN